MDEFHIKKKGSKIRKFTHLFVYIDKAIHADPIQNKRINLSFSLHPSLQPIVSPSAFVQFTHVRFLFGFYVSIESLIYSGIKSLSELQFQIKVKESSSLNNLGQCLLPFQSTTPSVKKSILTQSVKKTLNTQKKKNIVDIDKALCEFCKGYNRDSPNFIYQNAKIPVFEPVQTQFPNEIIKNKICDLILTLALGDENQGKLIMPTTILNQPISLKAVTSSPIQQSPIANMRKQLLNMANFSDSKTKHNAQKPIIPNPSSKLRTDQIQFVIRNWKKYAIQNGWTPPDSSESEGKDEFVKKDIVLDKKEKFTGLMNRKLIRISKESAETQSNSSEKDKNADNSATSISSFFQQSTEKEESQNSGIIKSNPTMDDQRIIKTIDSSSSIGPQRTTQYQIITEFSLNDSFSDKIQRGIFSDPPHHPDFILIGKHAQKGKESIKNDSSSVSMDEFMNTKNSPISLSQTPLEELNDISISEVVEMNKTKDELPFNANNTQDDYNLDSQTSKNDANNSSAKSASGVVSSEKDESSFEFENNSADIQYSENFNRLDEMISQPTIADSKKLDIEKFNNIVNIEPTIQFGKKEIIYVHIFGSRPNPSERINAQLMKTKRKSADNRNNSSFDQDSNNQLDTSKEIKKSPSLEQLLEKGLFELDLNLSGSSDN